jgi:CDP-diglyceride synthetase
VPRLKVEEPGKDTVLETMLLLHDRLSLTVMLFMGAVGIWGLFSYVRGQRVSGSFAGSLVIGELLILFQVLAGVAVYGGGFRPPTATHYLYGITAVLILPFAWSYFRERDQRQALMIYSLISLFIFGLAVRGMMTGR